MDNQSLFESIKHTLRIEILIIVLAVVGLLGLLIVFSVEKKVKKSICEQDDAVVVQPLPTPTPKPRRPPKTQLKH